MKSFEELRLTAMQKGQKFCEENETQLNTAPEYAAQKAAFDAAIKKVVDARAINMQSLNSWAEVKKVLQLIMVDLVFSYMLRASVKASELGKIDLEASLSFSKTYIMHNDDAGIGVKCTEFKNIIKTNLGSLTNILPVDITKMEEAIQAYDDILDAPKQAIDKRKAYGTDRINFLLGQADKPKVNLGKIIHSYFSELAIGWDQAIKVGTPVGVRHTSIALCFKMGDTDKKLKGVKCTITNGSEIHTATSTKSGWVRFYSLITDTWTATCELKTYETFTLSDIETDDKHVEKHTLALKKLPLPNGEDDPETTTGILSLIAYDKDTQEPLAGVVNSIPELEHSNTTDEDGEDYRDGIAPGTYQGTLFMEGKKPLNYTFTIEAGKTTTLQLYMENE